MMAAGVRGKAGLALLPPRDSYGLPASSSGYLLLWCWLTPYCFVTLLSWTTCLRVPIQGAPPCVSSFSSCFWFLRGLSFTCLRDPAQGFSSSSSSAPLPAIILVFAVFLRLPAQALLSESSKSGRGTCLSRPPQQPA